MNTMVIGDVHNHIKAAEELASRYEKSHKIIFVGDYFDDFYDTPDIAAATAMWLKESLHKPNRIHLYGNHDLHYSPFCEVNGKKLYMCSGYEPIKDESVKKILNSDDWIKMKLYHFESGIHFTHAGIAKEFFEHPINGLTNETIFETIKKTETNFYNREQSDVIGGAGYCRGGTNPVGGITWNDHNMEANPIRNITQVYGHTPVNNIDILEDNNGTNVCIDCGLSEILEIDVDGNFSIVETEFDNFYDPYKNINNKWG